MDRDARILGLDGLRGAAVAAVVAFHLWPSVVPGGFLGVSLFFTLSGYLIVSRLEDERTATGTVSLRRFWDRRARRILPAAVATLAIATVVWAAAGWLTRDISDSLRAAVLQMENWYQIGEGSAYGVDRDASPVLHFWSLAIEEQVYLVLPLVTFAVASPRVRRAAFTALLAAAVAATAVSAGDSTVVYYSTLTRSGEVLIGAVAALALRRQRRSVHGEHGLATAAIGAAGLAGFAWLVLSTSLGTSAYYSGGLLGVGLLSATIIGAATRSPVLGRLLDVRPLAVLGRISYGVYLVHWPLVVAADRTGVDGWYVPVGIVVATLAIAWLSDRYLETPLRTLRPRRARRRAFATVALGAVATLFVVVAVPRGGSPSAAVDLAAGRVEFDRRLASAGTSHPAVDPAPVTSVGADADPPHELRPRAPSPEPAPVRLGIFGDSKAIGFGLGLVPIGDPDVAMVGGRSEFACPLARSEEQRLGPGALPGTIPPACNWADRWPASLAESGPLDVALVYFGTWDALDQRGGGAGDEWTGLGDGAFDAWLLGEMRAATDVLAGSTTDVVWLTVGAPPDAPRPERFTRYNELIEWFAAGAGPNVSVIDLAGWLASTGDTDRLLPDGVHVTWDDPPGGTAREIGERYLIAEIERVAAG